MWPPMVVLYAPPSVATGSLPLFVLHAAYDNGNCDEDVKFQKPASLQLNLVCRAPCRGTPL
jgi:hypothetical protein